MNTPIAAQPEQFGCNGQLTSGVGMNTSFGYGNYNAMFVSLKMSNWHGMTMQSNFTYGKALGTGSQVQATSQYTIPDPYNLRPQLRSAALGPQIPVQPVDRLPTAILPGPTRFCWTPGWADGPSLLLLTPAAACRWVVSPGDAYESIYLWWWPDLWRVRRQQFRRAPECHQHVRSGVGGSSRHNNPVPVRPLGRNRLKLVRALAVPGSSSNLRLLPEPDSRHRQN